jgi:hypothetical protein
MRKIAKYLTALFLLFTFGVSAFADPSSGAGTGVGNGVAPR